MNFAYLCVILNAMLLKKGIFSINCVKKSVDRLFELLQIVRTAQKQPKGRMMLSNKLISHFKRSQFCFNLNSLVIVEVDVFVYEEASFLVGFEFDPVNALGF